jgi:hypothetical protein
MALVAHDGAIARACWLAGRYVITERMNIQSIRAASSTAPIDIRLRISLSLSLSSRCFRVRFLRSRLPRESGLTATYESVTYSVIIQRGDTLKYRTPYFTAAGNAASQTPLGINKP